MRIVRLPAEKVRRHFYVRKFRRSLAKLHLSPLRISVPSFGATQTAESPKIWNSLKPTLLDSKNIDLIEINASICETGQSIWNGSTYWDLYKNLYTTVGNAREKALEHSLTFGLIDFQRVGRYCDIASATSPIEKVLADRFSFVERWKQDILFKTDLSKRILGGFAQSLTDVPGGFFDAISLHCSFEHFSGDADIQFISEVDRILSDRGACLILPLYLDQEPTIYFDPTIVSSETLESYDHDHRLCPAYDYRQEHGRYYSPKTLKTRILDAVVKTNGRLLASVIRFEGQEAIDPSIYLNFGLVLHRANSVFLKQ